MGSLITLRKNFLIKSTAVATALCLMAGSLSICSYADEKTDSLHNTSEAEGIDEDNSGNSTNGSDTKKNQDEKYKPDADSEGSNETEGNRQDNGNGDKPDAYDDQDAEKEEKSTVSGNDVSGNDIDDEIKEEVTEITEYGELPEIVNVVVPTAYTLALNPYGLPIRTGGGTIITEQIISGTYGIVNKSSTDQIVTVSLTIEDRNGNKLIFFDSAEEAQNAEDGVYAIYLEAVPANEKQILIDGKTVDSSVTGEVLRKVEMTAADGQAIALHDGANKIVFKLSGAVYSDDNELMDLAQDGKGVSAYTFGGVMNPNAEWEKLSGGIKLSVVYTYQTAQGNEDIIEGTGAMLRAD